MGTVDPFEAAWSEAEVGRVLAAVRAYPWPPSPDAPDGWAYGCDGAFLKDLCAYWLDGYNWRAALAELNRYPAVHGADRGLRPPFRPRGG